MHPCHRTKHYLFIYSDVLFELDWSSRIVAFFFLTSSSSANTATNQTINQPREEALFGVLLSQISVCSSWMTWSTIPILGKLKPPKWNPKKSPPTHSVSVFSLRLPSPPLLPLIDHWQDVADVCFITSLTVSSFCGETRVAIDTIPPLFFTFDGFRLDHKVCISVGLATVHQQSEPFIYLPSQHGRAKHQEERC